MRTRADLRTGVKTGLRMVSTSTFVSDATINTELNDAHLWAADQYAWPVNEKAKNTVTLINQYYYDSPTEFKADSVFMVFVDGEEYTPTDFQDFIRYKKENPSDTSQKIFASFGTQFFLFPTPTVADLEIIVWGIIQPDDFVDDNSLTIFSNSEDSLNEAIVEKAISRLTKKTTESQAHLNKAKQILAEGWMRIAPRAARYKRKDAPFFNVPDLFPSGSAASHSNIGGFTIRG